MTTALMCASHSPIFYVRPVEPPYEKEIIDHYAERRAAIEAFEPELVIMFGPDHFGGFHLNSMPTFCIGTGTGEAIDDVGGFGGPLNVDGETARKLLLHMRAEGFDPAQSVKMTVDHGFSQVLKNAVGELDAYPIVPVFIGGMCQPFLQFARSRRFGEAVGRFAATLNKRVLFLGSGGLSHHPTRYYPLPGEADPDVEAWQMEGVAGGTFTEEEWLKRLYDMHVEGGEMLITGKRTRKDIRLNPEVDRKFLDVIATGDLSPLDDWKMEELFEQAGVGFTELHSWVAAIAANLTAGGTSPKIDYYLDTLEYAIGFGIVHADAA